MSWKRVFSLLVKLVPVAVIVGIITYNLLTFGVIEDPGKTVYHSHCAGCHGNSGEGIRQLIPPLVNADIAIEKFDSIPCWIREGMNGELVVNGIVYNQPMYPIKLNEVQIANVMNYIAKEFLKTKKEIKSERVRELLKQCRD